MSRISKRREMMGEEAWSEYQRQRKNEKAKVWAARNVESVVNWRRRQKLKLIAYKGSCCSICGYDKDVPGAYVFHHNDPNQKEFEISHKGKCRSWDTIISEVNKCTLLCQNCHAEVHNLEYQENRNKSIQKHKKWLKRKLAGKTILNKIECQQCKKKFIPNTKHVKFCNDICVNIFKRKVEWPEKEQLSELLAKHNWCEIGRMFNVSDNAVRKWARHYGILDKKN